MIKILIAEDEPQLRAAIAKSLTNEGYSVLECVDGVHALETFSNEHVDLIVTDIMMPRMDGNLLVKAIREINQEIPIIMLTALDTIEDKVSGFQNGVDDYLVKPFLMKELCVRMKAMLRRAKINTDQKIILPSTTLDSQAQTLCVEGKQIELNKKQFQLLFKLLSNPNIIFSREQLLNEIWGYDSFSTDRTVDTHISWLRTKAASPDYEILAVWGLGYKAVLK